MFKIYPDEYVSNQIIIPSINGEIIFTFLENNLEIIYGDMHMKIHKNSINRVIIKEYKDNNCIKIFLKIEKSINMEYILYSNNFKKSNIVTFFKEFS